MKVILTRSKPLSERISAFLSAICHSIVGGLWQNTKGHSASRHNSATGEKYIMKKEGKEKGKGVEGTERNRERDREKEQAGALRPGRKRNAQRKQHNVKLPPRLRVSAAMSRLVG